MNTAHKLLLLGGAGGGAAIVTDGLVVAYHMDEGSGQQVVDYSDNDYHAQLGSTAGVDANDPTWVAGVGLDFASAQYLTATVPDAPFLGAMTAIVVANFDVGGQLHELVGKSGASATSGNPFDFRTSPSANNRLYIDRWDASSNGVAWNAPNYRIGAYRMYAMQCGENMNDAAHQIWLNTTKLPMASNTAGTPSGPPTGSNAALRLGRRTQITVQFNGKQAYALLYSRKLTDAEIVQNFEALEAIMAARGVTLNAAAILFDGDSLTTGVGSTGTNNYPEQCIGILGDGYDNINVGVSGQRIDAMLSDAETQIDPMYSADRTGNIVVCWGGTNDLYAGQGATTTYNEIVSYCQGRQAAGFQVVVLTILPRSDAGVDPNFETDRQTVNTNIRNNWASFADALADVAADTRIGDDGDSDDVTYYADAVHMTDAGYAIVAQIVADAIETL